MNEEITIKEVIVYIEKGLALEVGHSHRLYQKDPYTVCQTVWNDGRQGTSIFEKVDGKIQESIAWMS